MSDQVKNRNGIRQGILITAGALSLCFLNLVVQIGGFSAFTPATGNLIAWTIFAAGLLRLSLSAPGARSAWVTLALSFLLPFLNSPAARHLIGDTNSENSVLWTIPAFYLVLVTLGYAIQEILEPPLSLSGHRLITLGLLSMVLFWFILFPGAFLVIMALWLAYIAVLFHVAYRLGEPKA